MASMEDVETERLLLRRWREDDLDPLAAIFAKPEVWRFPFQRGFSRDETETFLARRFEEWGSQGWGLWAAADRTSGELLGFIGLSVPAFLPEVLPAVEVGWRLDPRVWGRGLATEGGRAALAAGFGALGLDAVVSIYEPENVASGRVMEHLGMTPARDTVHPELGVPLRVYRITREQWTARP